MMEHGNAAERTSSTESRWRSSQFNAEETNEAQGHLFIKLGKKSEEMKTQQVPWSHTARAALQNQYLESSTPNSVYEAVEYQRHRL